MCAPSPPYPPTTINLPRCTTEAWPHLWKGGERAGEASEEVPKSLVSAAILARDHLRSAGHESGIDWHTSAADPGLEEVWGPLSRSQSEDEEDGKGVEASRTLGEPWVRRSTLLRALSEATPRRWCGGLKCSMSKTDQW